MALRRPPICYTDLHWGKCMCLMYCMAIALRLASYDLIMDSLTRVRLPSEVEGVIGKVRVLPEPDKQGLVGV